MGRGAFRGSPLATSPLAARYLAARRSLPRRLLLDSSNKRKEYARKRKRLLAVYCPVNYSFISLVYLAWQIGVLF